MHGTVLQFSRAIKQNPHIRARSVCTGFNAKTLI